MNNHPISVLSYSQTPLKSIDFRLVQPMHICLWEPETSVGSCSEAVNLTIGDWLFYVEGVIYIPPYCMLPFLPIHCYMLTLTN